MSGFAQNMRRVACGWLLAGLALALHAAVPMAGSPFGPVVTAALAGETEDPAPGNRVAIVSGGYDALLLRVHLIRLARVSIDIQTFIWLSLIHI